MLRLEIVTPEKRVLDAEVDSVTLMTASGETGILPSHAPLISALKPGVLTYVARGTNGRLAVSGGFVEVNADRVSVLADSAQSADEVNVDSARAERESAERALAQSATAPVEETELIRDELEAASVRLQIASGR